jgi:lipid II:glycine glycyltransferase (peptidoglycan interpeptide bridge formation enzyme)
MATTSSPTVNPAFASSIRVRECHEPAIWDDAIGRLSGGILQSWSWGEFKQRHGWRPVRLLSLQGDVACAAAQVLIRQVGPMTVLYCPRGPVAGDSSSEASAALTVAIDTLARSERAVIAFAEPESTVSGQLPLSGSLAWEPSSVELQPLRTIKVSVDRDDEEILSGMKSKTRYNVRLAGRRGVAVREGDISDIAPFYALLQETSDRDAFGIHSVKYYADMLNVFGDRAALLLAEYEGKIAAGAIVLKHLDEAIYMFGASSSAYQRHMPTHLLQFEAMKWARSQGCSWYDLWGIPPTDEPPDEARDGGMNVRNGLWGVYRFKQGFGGEIVSYPGVLERQYYPSLVRLWRRFRSGPGA